MNISDSTHIIPEIIVPEYPVNEVAPIVLPNKFACFVGASFGVATISDDLTKVSFERAKGHFPKIPIGNFGSNEDGTVMWGQEGYRGFLAYHFPSGTSTNTCPDTYMQMMGAVAPRGRTSLVFVSMYNRRRDTYFVYDAEKGIKVFDNSEQDAYCALYPFDNYTFVGGKACPTGTGGYCWAEIGFAESGFHPTRENELTKLMTEKNIGTRFRSRSFGFDTKVCIGSLIPGNSAQVVIQWEEGFKDCKISPLVIQCPQGFYFEDVWEFSLDGRWLAARPEIAGEDARQLFFYHVDEKYPQRISPPIYGGHTPIDGRGCFVNHSVFGPIYVDLGLSPPSLLVYKMSDVLKSLAK